MHLFLTFLLRVSSYIVGTCFRLYLFIKLKTYPSETFTIINREQVFTNHYKVKIDHWSVTFSPLQCAEHADHLFTAQGPRGAQEPRDGVLGRRVTIVHSMELCLCHTLIVWISICTGYLTKRRLCMKNWSQILIVLLACYLSPRDWREAACNGEEVPYK